METSRLISWRKVLEIKAKIRLRAVREQMVQSNSSKEQTDIWEHL